MEFKIKMRDPEPLKAIAKAAAECANGDSIVLMIDLWNRDESRKIGNALQAQMRELGKDVRVFFERNFRLQYGD